MALIFFSLYSVVVLLDRLTDLLDQDSHNRSDGRILMLKLIIGIYPLLIAQVSSE